MSTPASNQSQPKSAPDGYKTWNEYWTKVHNQPWRTKPEIDGTRQQYLAERRVFEPIIEEGIYPFKGVPLDRADVEWLLATHSSGGMVGPVNWDDGGQRQREGLDLRGAELPNVDLSGLPLARLHAGLDGGAEYDSTTLGGGQRERAAMRMPGAILNYAHLEGARLSNAHMEGVTARQARFNGAELYQVHLEGDPPADLRYSVFDERTRLDYATVGNKSGDGPRLRGVQWGGVDQSFVDWSKVQMLDDERIAHGWKTYPHDVNDTRLKQYRRAVQVNSVLSNALRASGASQQADYFAYRAKVCQRSVLWRQGVRSWGAALGSWLLDLTSGYGYKPMRSICTYIVVILSFAAFYFALTNFALAPFLPSHSSPLHWYEAIVLSVSSFHGRGLYPTGLSLGDPVAIFAALEAIIGLLIEITFIATFTQRFFAR